MRMRPETINKSHFDMFNVTMEPILAEAPEALKRQESENIAEDRISLLYSDLVPPSLLPPRPIAQQSLARRMKNMAHVDLGAAAKTKRSSSASFDDDDERDSEEECSDDELGESVDGSSRHSSSQKGRGRSTSGGGGTRKIDLKNKIIITFFFVYFYLFDFIV